jgi:hypothetical protein
VFLCQIPAPEVLAGLRRCAVCLQGVRGREAGGLILSSRRGCPLMAYWKD